MISDSTSAGRPGRALCLLALFLLALLPRWYSAQTLGWGWDSPTSFSLVNFDEGGSCRAALGGFDYSTFTGRQTIAIAKLLGRGPPQGIYGNDSAVKSYCHSASHILVARSYSAVLGAMTVVLLAGIALVLLPATPGVAWTAGVLLALSGFHIAESHSGTVDAVSVFFIYAFLALMVHSVGRGSGPGLWASPLLLVPAIWTKYWVFALFSYVAVTPARLWRYLAQGFSGPRIAVLILAAAVLMGALTNSASQAPLTVSLLVAYYLVIPWRRINRPMIGFWLLLPVGLYGLTQVELIARYTTGSIEGRFGSSYGAIGANKWLRNLVNIPAVLAVGLGIPACLFIPAGIRFLLRRQANVRAWLCLTPVAAFLLYMAFISPVTYYRHYLAILPAAALLAACGLFATSWHRRRWFMLLFFSWPALLAVDLVMDYHRDPRLELRSWYEQHPGSRNFITFYVNPPAGAGSVNRLFRPLYAYGDAAPLRQADYLILSENWYDTAFANELNGPKVNDLAKLIKTRPREAGFYRAALAGAHPNLRPERAIEVSNFMPELILHKRYYGTFQLFVGDIRIFRVVD